jgi:hypothetical protein
MAISIKLIEATHNPTSIAVRGGMRKETREGEERGVEQWRKKKRREKKKVSRHVRFKTVDTQ